MQQTSYTSAPPRGRDNRHTGAQPARGCAGLDDLLEIVVNKRMKKTWRVQVNFKTGERILTIPAVLANPPQEVKDCLIRWAMMPMTRRARRNSEFVKTKRELEATIRAYMESSGVAQERKSRLNPNIFEHQTKGFAYDLREIFDALNRAYFKGELKSYIRWGQADSRTSYQATRTDKDGNSFNLITISGVYDSPQVPEYAIYGLVYHEMLHIAIPPRMVNSRRVIHGRDFKAAEKKYPFLDQWAEWERENMGRLVKNAKRRVKKAKAAAKR
ncbi:MAG: SprT-like domain-containing protein [Chitinispirillia bacterium]|nr:SprT-like domain-containing protein [Chitinispirillia bacterium]MCL2242089.1 SprT-like domain-containing protein [Chitinispirillia bacterium]